MTVAAVDWTSVLDSFLGAIPAALVALYAAGKAHVVKREITTPSGDSIGLVAERTHDLAAVATLSTAAALRGGNQPPPVSAGPGLDHTVERINSDPEGPVKVNGGEDGLHS